jgi:TRAP-type C4-dicarboxylate transport system permease small subunit
MASLKHNYGQKKAVMRFPVLVRFVNLVNGFLMWPSMFLVAFMLGTVVYDVMSRTLLNAPVLAIPELNEYAVVYMAFVPAGLILMMDGHIKITLVTERLGFRSRRISQTLVNLLGLFYTTILMWQGWMMAWHTYTLKAVFPTIVGIPKFPVQVIIPIGAGWLVLNFLVKLLAYAGRDEEFIKSEQQHV